MDGFTINKHNKQVRWVKCLLFFLLIICSSCPTIKAKKQNDENSSSTSSSILISKIKSKFTNWINGEDSSFSSSSTFAPSSPSNNKKATLSIIEISDMRVRDIKRRLSRQHGYGADELAMMLDKKELINALAFEEHKVEQKEKERKKRVALRRSIIVALFCVIIVMFKGLFVHVYEVASVNFVVYTDKKRYEWGKCREMKSIKALFGLFLMFTVDILQLWLTTSVILSWVMRSKYFFPIPYIPIKPAALLAPAAGSSSNIESTPFANYGVNVGPMVISALFRFANGRLEGFMGKALSDAYKKQKRVRKAEKKEEERLEAERLRRERKAARKARREERELRKQQQELRQQQQQEQYQEQESPPQASTTQVDDDNICENENLIHDTSENKTVSNHNNNDTSIGGMDELD